MAEYLIQLKNVPGSSMILETVRAWDDDEARAFAMLRLSLTTDYRIAMVWDADRLVGHFVRDTGRAGPSIH